MSKISARCFYFFGNISATICKNLIFKFFHLVRKVFLICAKSDSKAVSYAVKNSENLSGVNTNELSPTMATFEIKGANFVNEKGETVVGEYNDNNYKYSFYCKKGLNGNRVYNYIKKMITE